MFPEVFPGAMQTGFHRRDTGGENFGNFGMAPALLHQREQRTILGPKLREGVAQRIELLRIDGSRRLGNVFVFRPERQENPAEFLAAELINAGIAREPKKPRLELGGGLKSIEGTDHLDEHLLCKIFYIITPASHGIDETGHPALVADNELPLGSFFALLSPEDQVNERGR
jgi:hypothetical protein